MSLLMDHHQMNQETEDLLEEMMIGEMNLNIHQIEDHQEEGPLDLQEETLEEDPLDEMDVMVEEVDMDLQEEMAEMEKMDNLEEMDGMEKMVILDEMEEEDHMVTLDLDMLYQLKQQFCQQQEM